MNTSRNIGRGRCLDSVLACLLLGLLSAAALPAATVTLYRNTTYQTIWGFGAAANHPVKFVHNLPDSNPNKQEIMDRLFGQTDTNAGLSIVRLEVNAYTQAEDPDQTTCMPAPGVRDWNSDQHQRWFAQEAKNRGMNQFYAVPWSPPAWMKGTESYGLPGSVNNGGHLLASHFADFAYYMRSYVYWYKQTLGFNIRWVSIQNEPDLATAYASCRYTTSELNNVASLVADELHDLASDMGWNLMVAAPEGSSRQWTQTNYLGSKTLTDATRAKLDFYPTHDYSDSENYGLTTNGKLVFNSEVCDHNALNDASITDGLRWGNKIAAALKRGEPGWMYWWCVSPPGERYNQGLINLNSDGSYTINKRLHVMGQFSRYFRPDNIRLLASSNDGNIVSVATKAPGDGKASVVLINNSTSDVPTTVDGFTTATVIVRRTSASESMTKLADLTVSSGAVSLSLPAKSVTTLVEF
jgi:glucuronoarabinoxylan endo-1,4-beta-xylanase